MGDQAYVECRQAKQTNKQEDLLMGYLPHPRPSGKRLKICPCVHTHAIHITYIMHITHAQIYHLYITHNHRHTLYTHIINNHTNTAYTHHIHHTHIKHISYTYHTYNTNTQWAGIHTQDRESLSRPAKTVTGLTLCS